MKFDKYNKQFARVVFLDATDSDNRFDKDFEPIKCCAIGWLTKKTKSFVRLVWLLDEIDDPSAGIAIPNGSIITIQYLDTYLKFQTRDDKIDLRRKEFLKSKKGI